MLSWRAGYKPYSPWLHGSLRHARVLRNLNAQKSIQCFILLETQCITLKL